MKHTEKLTMQDTDSFIIAFVIMAGTHVQCLENSLSDYIETSSYHVITFNHKQQDL